jgi:mRNA-degrading endonuclease toxin of MazEF toxin-antitoxin module
MRDKKQVGGPAKDSIVNVSQLVTLSKDFLVQRVARIPPARIREVESGLRLVLSP